MSAVHYLPSYGGGVTDQIPDQDTKPQLSDGYTRIVNSVMEALPQSRLSALELAMCIFICRKTFGFNKGKDKISGSQLGEGLAINQKKAAKILAQLLRKNVVIREGSSHGPIKINTKTHEWIKPDKKTRPPENPNLNRKTAPISPVFKKGTKYRNWVPIQYPNWVHTIDKRQTTNSASQSMVVQSTDRADETDRSKPSPKAKPPVAMKPGAVVQSPNGRKWGEQVDLDIAELMARAVDHNIGQDAPATRNMIGWANEIRLLRHRDNRPEGAIRALIAWSQQHHFWHKNILSPEKLRKQWTRLAIERNDERKQGGPNETRRKNTRSGRSAELIRQQTDLQYAVDNF
jgi:phage replication O-like protein O